MNGSIRLHKLLFVVLWCWIRVPRFVCLRDVYISLPDAVEKDERIRMICKYNLEGETLYTLKWFKGDLEFFRYTPKEIPSTKFFAMKAYPELEVIREESYGDQITLKRASLSVAGHYACEVTTDAPSFHALSGQGELRVVVLPQEIPTIKGYKPKIKEGEWAKVACHSDKSIPAANLTWSINNNKVIGEHHIQVSKRIVDELEQSVSNLSFLVNEKHFGNQNSIKVRCTASIYLVHQRTAEINLLLDRPNKFIYNPEKQANPYFISITQNGKPSRVDKHNIDNVIDAENLANGDSNWTTITLPSPYLIPFAIIIKLLC